MSEWTIQGPKDRALVRPDWSPRDPVPIEGVSATAISNVITNDGYLTEIWRSDWNLDDRGVGQVFQRVLERGAASGWHVHAITTDRLFSAYGRLRLGLFDARADSPTCGNVAEFRVGAERPATIVVPPGVWHAVRNIGDGALVYLNVVDMAYDYDDPDHYRLPLDTPEIPMSI